MKKWLARVGLAIAAPLVFFGALEGALRLAGFGHDTSFFIPDRQPGIYRTNPHFTELFFPASFGLKPVNFRLPKAKPAGSTRVFVLGGSAAMGVPAPAFAVAPQLRAQLRAAYPGRHIQVYNLGMTAINSHVVLTIVRQAVRFHPDLLVIYLGNNEVVGPYGPGGDPRDAMLPLWLIRAGIWIRGTRTGQLLQRIARRLGRTGSGFQDWRGMETFSKHAVRADSPRLQKVYRDFAANLESMVALARAAGVKVLLSTVAVDVKDCAPFASRHRPGLSAARLKTWTEEMARARIAEGLGQTQRAQTLLEGALAIDPDYASTHFRLAGILAARGEADAARRQYLDARQWDALRFRADAQINRIIRRTARAAPGGVGLVDAAQAMGAAASSTVPPAGHRFFLEHVHLTWRGNYTLVRLLAARAGATLFPADRSPDAWLSSSACAKVLGYTDVGRREMLLYTQEMTGRPPFTGQLDFAANRAHLRREIAAVNAALAVPGALAAAAARIDAARRRDPDNPDLVFNDAAVNLATGDFVRALALNRRLAGLEPPAPELMVQRAYLLMELRQPAKAEALLLHAAATSPYYFQTYGMLASIWHATGRTPHALDYFAALVKRMPASAGARLTYAHLLGVSGQEEAAMEQWRAVLRLIPDNEAALKAVVHRLKARGREDEAIALMVKAHAYNPHDFDNDARLEQIYEARGDLANTIKYLRAMAESGPVRADLHAALARDLMKLGHRDQALVELRQARRAATAEDNAALLRTVDDMMQKDFPDAR